MIVVEFFCGIGGCAAACPAGWNVVAAIDVNQHALRAYRHNFSHPIWTNGVEHLSADRLRALQADLWWFSPPCQPFTVRGNRRDLDDPRAAVFPAMVRHMEVCLPEFIVLENVVGFQGSRAQSLWVGALRRSGYFVHELLLCPTTLSVPARRPRWYVLASRREFEVPDSRPDQPLRSLHQFLDLQLDPREWLVPPEIQQRYANTLHIVDPYASDAATRCFTSAYGTSPVRSGSYIQTDAGPRYATPQEIVRLLGFPDFYELPGTLTRRQAWSLAGNSLSITAVRQVLQWLTEGTAPKIPRTT